MKDDLKAFVAGAIFLTLVFSVVTLDLTRVGTEGPRVSTFEPWTGDPSGPEEPRTLARFMFGTYALPLEVLSVVLLVALVGALVLAKPEHPAEDEP